MLGIVDSNFRVPTEALVAELPAFSWLRSLYRLPRPFGRCTDTKFAGPLQRSLLRPER